MMLSAFLNQKLVSSIEFKFTHYIYLEKKKLFICCFIILYIYIYLEKINKSNKNNNN